MIATHCCVPSQWTLIFDLEVEFLELYFAQAVRNSEQTLKLWLITGAVFNFLAMLNIHKCRDVESCKCICANYALCLSTKTGELVIMRRTS